MKSKEFYLVFWSITIIGFIPFADGFAGEITVSGKCQKRVDPDRARLNFSSEVTQPTAEDAQKKVNQMYDRVRASVKKLNFKDLEIQTESISVNEDIDWSGGKRKSKGYRAQAMIEVTTSELDRIGEAVPVAIKAGANAVGGLALFLSNDLFEKSYQDCLGEAVKNSRLKAEKILSAQSKKVLDVLEIIEGERLQQWPQPVYAKMAMAESTDARSSAPQIESKKQAIDVSVTAKYKF